MTSVVFDLDDTLYEEKAPKVAAECHVASRLAERLGVADAEALTLFVAAKRETLRQRHLGPARNDRRRWITAALERRSLHDDVLVERLATEYWETLLDNLRPYADALIALPVLADRFELWIAATRELGVLVRARTCMVEARTAASNQLWAVLAEHWPGAAMLFQKLTSKIALAFLTDYPTPQAAAHLGEGRMSQFCRRHAYRGGKPPAELIGRLRAAPAAASPITPEILAAIVAGSVAQIRVLNAGIARLEQAIAEALSDHPKAVLLEDLPRAATVSLAQLIAEVGPLLDRCDNPEQVAAICGAAPITRASGKTHTVGFRYAANKPARVAITGFADNSRHASVWAAQRYSQARARGARHPHAVRILARAWLRVIWACWHTGNAYDPSRHRAEQLATHPNLTNRTQALHRTRGLQPPTSSATRP